MTSELVIDVQPKEISIAILEDKKLVEYQKEARNISFAVGDVYLGKIKKLMPGLNAAFVDVGYKKDAFLHYQDLGPGINTLQKFLDTASNKKKILPIGRMERLTGSSKEGSITDVLKQGNNILVQIAKEPISTKGPRLTAELSFAGRFLVALPFGDKVNVSSKLKTNEERMRLKQLIQSIKPKNFGVIVRTSAEGKRVAELDTELKTLVRRWEDNVPKVLKTSAPALIYEETGRVVALLRDIFNESFEHIYVNDEKAYNEIHDYLSLIDPDKATIVESYKGEVPIFDHFAITKQLKSGFGKTVTVKNGSYLIIEHTEAMHVIDVNSGNRSRASSDQENTAAEVNLAAAEEIARQLRLRDMGGIIAIDFIDMRELDHRQHLYDAMRKYMVNDRAKHNILPVNKFGVMLITRQRVRPVLDFTTDETCPVCFGKGSIRPSIFFMDVLEEKISEVVQNFKVKKFKLYVHPYIAAFIKQGVFSQGMKWKLKYSMGMRIIPDQSLGLLEYKFIDWDKTELNTDDESLKA
ncbi:MAG: Ribonuclease G [Candidatus Ordinivivax streblomastigis]|uniref:Ribonuclease G n=1 Tax=Candidatus Ordinivivax streblomastigis TaxID=2540710 RepID=A0A5M8P331_9BACT|nr:MAG: Ribonuclease G [Candidatus Ordinivivax streblomastigis]